MPGGAALPGLPALEARRRGEVIVVTAPSSLPAPRFGTLLFPRSLGEGCRGGSGAEVSAWCSAPGLPGCSGLTEARCWCHGTVRGGAAPLGAAGGRGRAGVMPRGRLGVFAQRLLPAAVHGQLWHSLSWANEVQNAQKEPNLLGHLVPGRNKLAIKTDGCSRGVSWFFWAGTGVGAGADLQPCGCCGHRGPGLALPRTRVLCHVAAPVCRAALRCCRGNQSLHSSSSPKPDCF